MGWRDRLLGGAEAARRERLRSLIAARRRMVDQVYSPGADAITYRVVPRSIPPDRSEALGIAEALTRSRGDIRSGAIGSFAPTRDLDHTIGTVAYPAGVRGNRRHEVMHGYNEAARRGLPGIPVSSRVTAAMPEMFRRPLDEIVASRVGGKPLMEIPWDAYAERFADIGQVGAANVARSLHAAQVAREAARRAGRFASDNPMATGATIGGGGTLLYGLMSGDDGQ